MRYKKLQRLERNYKEITKIEPALQRMKPLTFNLVDISRPKSSAVRTRSEEQLRCYQCIETTI